MCVFFTQFWSAQPLCVYIEGDKSEQQHGCQSDSLKGVSGGSGGGGTNHHRHHHHCPACSCALASMQQTAFSSQKPLYHLVFLCIRYPHFSLNDLRRIMCSHVSFLYCQNVSLGDQLGERSWYTVQRFFFCLSLKQYEHSFCSWWEVPSSEYGQVSSFWVVRECVCVWVNVCVCACVCECFNMFSVIGWMSSVWCCHTWNLCDDLIPSLSAGLSWC